MQWCKGIFAALHCVTLAWLWLGAGGGGGGLQGGPGQEPGRQRREADRGSDVVEFVNPKLRPELEKQGGDWVSVTNIPVLCHTTVHWLCRSGSTRYPGYRCPPSKVSVKPARSTARPAARGRRARAGCRGWSAGRGTAG